MSKKKRKKPSKNVKMSSDKQAIKKKKVLGYPFYKDWPGLDGLDDDDEEMPSKKVSSGSVSGGNGTTNNEAIIIVDSGSEDDN